MTISKRERFIIIAVGLFLLLVLFYMFVFSYVNDKKDEAQASMEAAELQYNNQKVRVDKATADEIEMNKLKKLIEEKSGLFYEPVDQEEIIQLIHDYTVQSHITISKVDFKEYGTEWWKDYQAAADQKAKEESAAAAESAKAAGSSASDGASGGEASGSTNASTSVASDASGATSGASSSTSSKPVSEFDLMSAFLNKVKVLEATVDYEGTQEAFREFVKLIDENDKAVLTCALTWQDTTPKSSSFTDESPDSSEPMCRGQLLIRWYQIPPLDMNESSSIGSSSNASSDAGSATSR